MLGLDRLDEFDALVNAEGLEGEGSDLLGYPVLPRPWTGAGSAAPSFWYS